MGNEFRADPDRLRAKAPAFEQLGAEVEALVQRLHDLVSADSAPWGGDDSGKAFAESFAPEEKRTLSDLNSLTEVVRQAGPDLRQVAANFEQRDLRGGREVRSADPVLARRTDTVPNNPAVPAGAGGSDTPTGATVTPAAGTARARNSGSDLTGPRSRESAASTSAEGAVAKRASPAGPDSPGGAAALADAQQRPLESPGQPAGPAPGNRSRAEREGSPTAAQATVPPAARAAQPATAEAQRAQVPPSPAPVPPKGAVPAPTGTAPATPTSPWSKSAAGGPPRVTAPGSGASDAPPRMPNRAPQRPIGKPAEPERRPGGAAVEPIASRLAQELAERHGILAFGFDTPGVPREVLLEIVAAVNDVLPRHPALSLSAIGIDDLPKGTTIRLDSEPADSGPEPSGAAATGYIARITLAARAAVEPAGLQRAVHADEAAGLLAPGCAQRPVYSSVVREMGRALDAAGGFRARTATRRALVAAYLPLASRDTAGSLARTVSGFGVWRAQLAGGFRAGRFDPEAALAEAFTEVVLDVARASQPARTLHRLLVDTADAARTRPESP
ncbi:hypothetical protein AB0M34_03335 [Nocardia sp. NPDC050193]